MTSLPPVARSIYVFCKKCNTDRYFKVITHTSSTTAKLKCEVCKASRNYSIEDEKKSPAPVRKRAPAGTPKPSKAAAHWILLKDQYRGGGPVDYSTAHQFKDRDSLMHPTFGLGFVTKTHANKIEVVFADSVKELLHARKP